MSIILETRSISKSFGVGAAKVSAVDQISLQIRMGEILLIMGPSGSGKTTFLSMLGGLLSADDFASEFVVPGQYGSAGLILYGGKRRMPIATTRPALAFRIPSRDVSRPAVA